MADPATAALFRPDVLREVSIFVKHPTGIIKARFDLLDLENDAIYDVKTTQDASAEGFFEQSEKFRYGVQQEFYRMVARMAYGRVFSFSFLAVEMSEPNDYAIRTLPPVCVPFWTKLAAVEEGSNFQPQSGAILLQMAKSTGQRDANGNGTYNWREKLVFKLNADDLSSILLVLQDRREKYSFVHDPAKSGSVNADRGMKNLFVEWKKYNKNGADVRGVIFTIRHDVLSVCVGLAENEIITLRSLISAAIPRIYG